MAITKVYAEDNTKTTRTAVGTGDAGASISGASLTANTEYLVIGRALWGCDSADYNGASIRMYSADHTGTDEFTPRSTARTEFQLVTAADGLSYFFVYLLTTDSTPADIKFQLTSNGTAGVWIDESSIMAIETVSSFGTKETDWHTSSIGSTGAEYSTTAQTTTLTSIPSGDLGTDEWIVLGYAKTGIGSTGRWFDISVYGAPAGEGSETLVFDHRAEGEDTLEDRMVGYGFRHKGGGVGVGVTAYGLEEASNGNMTIEGAFMVALPASAFESWDYDWDTTTDNGGSTETTYGSVGPYTPTTNGDHIVMSFGRTNIGTQEGALWFEDGTTEIRAGDSGVAIQQNWDTSKDRESFALFQQYSITGSTTMNVRGLSSQNGWGARQVMTLVLSLESSSGTTYTDDVSAEVTLTADSTDIQTMIENRAALIDFTAAHTDVATLDETGHAALIDFTVASTDAISFDELLSALVDFTTASTDVATLSEVGLSSLVELTAAHTDVVVITESHAAFIDLTAASTDGLVLDETGLLAFIELTAASTDDQTMIDSLAALIDLTTVSTDDQTMIESRAAAIDLLASSTDALVITESHAALIDFTTAGFDEIGFFETLAALIELTAASTDVATLDETGHAALVDLTATSTDDQTMVEARSAQIDLTTASTDEIILLDVLTALVDLSTASTDTVDITESYAALIDFTTTHVDNLVLAEALSALIELTATSWDQHEQGGNEFTDNLAALVDFTATSNDTVNMVLDALSALVDFTSASSDTLTLTDAMISLIELSATSADDQTMLDNLAALIVLTSAGTDDGPSTVDPELLRPGNEYHYDALGRFLVADGATRGEIVAMLQEKIGRTDDDPEYSEAREQYINS